MSVSIDIVPLSSTVDMFGEPDPSSAYSLSGHVSISLVSVKSLFQHVRPTCLILESLTVTFEGQSETITAQTGYIPFRLCTVTRELVPSDETIELSNEGYENSAKPCVWNVIFNIPIPGWLPASSFFGLDDTTGTKYTLYANAKFLDLDSSRGPSWLPMLCYLCGSAAPTTAEAHTPITVNRYTEISASSPMSSFSSQFSVSVLDNDPETNSCLSPKIEVMVDVPSHVDMSQSSFPFVMHLRPRNMDESHRRGFQVNGFSVQLCQVETFRDEPSEAYARRYPLLPSSSQPPQLPLRSAHSLGVLHDLGFFSPITPDTVLHRVFPLLPNKRSGRFTISDSYVFANMEEMTCDMSWHSMKSSLPLVPERDSVDESHWAGPERLRPSGTSPLFDVHHEMFISISCTYTGPGSDKRVESNLQFRVPLCFANVAPLPPSAAPTPPSPCSQDEDSVALSSMDMDTETTPLFIDVAPRPRSLPAYSQLFDATGERLIDYATPLPVYSPKP